MQKIILVVAILIASVSHAEFRNQPWGTPKADFIASEGDPLQATDTDLFYEISLAGIDMYLMAGFEGPGLSSGGYIKNYSFSTTNENINNYSTLKELLLQKYGEPVTDDEMWRNDLYQDDYLDWHKAVEIQHLMYRTIWQTDISEIMLVLHGEDYESTLGVFYSQAGATEQRREETTQDALNQL